MDSECRLASLQRLNLGGCSIYSDSSLALPTLAALTRLELDRSWPRFQFDFQVTRTCAIDCQGWQSHTCSQSISWINFWGSCIHCHDIGDLARAHKVCRKLPRHSPWSVKPTSVFVQLARREPACHIGGLLSLQTPCLLHLSVAGSSSIDNIAMELLGGLTKLQHLDLDVCKPFTDDGIFCLSALVELTSLSLQGCVCGRSCIGCWTLAALQHMTNLAELNLAERQFQALALLPMGQLTSVTMLNLRSCKVRSESDIQAISCLQRLRHLDLQACMGVSDASMQYICHLQQLTFLNLAKNGCLSNAAIDQLSSMTNLQHLEIGDCPNITEPAVDELYVALPRLRTLRSNSIDREVIPARALQGCRIVQS